MDLRLYHLIVVCQSSQLGCEPNLHKASAVGMRNLHIIGFGFPTLDPRFEGNFHSQRSRPSGDGHRFRTGHHRKPTIAVSQANQVVQREGLY